MTPTALGDTIDSESVSSPANRLVGERYRLRESVGSGGMGTVWRSYDELLRRDVAIKEVTIPDGVPTRERDLLCERMLREARAAAALNHPNVVGIFDVVNDDGRPFIVMEMVESQSLADMIKANGPLKPSKCAEVGLAVLDALETAHDAGVLHRDVKPGNILLAESGRIVLTDFGAARSPNDTPLTSTGLLLGSPQYIAPERARGRPFGAASDIFSLGSSLYAAVEGHPPFDRGDPLSTMTAVVCEPPDQMIRAGALAPVLEKLLAKEPGDRPTVEEARKLLRAVLKPDEATKVDPVEQDPDPATSRTLSCHVDRGLTTRRRRTDRPTTDIPAPERAAALTTERRKPRPAATTGAGLHRDSTNGSGRHRRPGSGSTLDMALGRNHRGGNRAKRHRKRKVSTRVWVAAAAAALALLVGGYAVHEANAAEPTHASSQTP